jgi:hypothetical protein
MTSPAAHVARAFRTAPSKTLDEHLALLASTVCAVRCTALAGALFELEKSEQRTFASIRGHVPMLINQGSRAETPQVREGGLAPPLDPRRR